MEAQRAQSVEEEVVLVADEDPEDWPEAGPQNIKEAENYVEKLNNIWEAMAENVSSEKKDALPSAIRSFKKLVSRHWPSMGDADPDVVIRSIHDPACVYLRQHLSPEGLQMIDPVEEVPVGHQFLRQLPEKQRREEEKMLIIDTLDHASEAFAHISSCCANLSSLAKITDRETLHTVMKATIRPLVQFNVPEKFLSPVEDPKKKTSAEETQEKLKKVLLPKSNTAAMARQPYNGATRILAPAVWLNFNRKFFSEGTAKEACELFKVWAKQLSRVLTGKKYMGGTQAQKRKASNGSGQQTPKKRKVSATVAVNPDKDTETPKKK